MYMTMGMGGSQTMMSMMGASSPLAGAGLGGGLLNPGMGAAMSMMSQAQMAGGASMLGGAGELGDPSAQKAAQTVQDALAKAGRQVADELKANKRP
jgi:hypothetical protein